MSYIRTDSQNYVNIANAIRNRNFSSSTYRPDQMAAAINSIPKGIDIDPHPDIYSTGDTWTRPSNYPDLDSINIPADFDGVYMTYDLNRTPGWGFIGIYVNTPTNGTKYYVERGHIENGEFIADYTAEQTNATYFRQDLDEANGTVQLWRVYSTAHIIRIVFVGSGTATNAMRFNSTQPCVERRGQLPYVTDCSSYLSVRYNISDGVFGTWWLEKDNLDIGKNSVVTNLSGMYGWCYRLVDVNLNWDTDNWRVTNLSSMFSSCVSLRSVDFSNWDTSNWAVTNLSSMFSACSAIKEFDFSTWNTSKWSVTTMATMFANCMSVKSIDLTDWDVSDWNITALNGLFSGCRSLTNVDFTGWDTSGWAVTTIASMFENCLSLENIDLSVWDTANWKVTAMNLMFSNCFNLKSANLTNWDTSLWKITTMASMFNSCFALETIDLSWNTSNWAVTTFAYMFDYCRSLQSINVSSWNTSSWVVTTFTAAFRTCYNLTEITGFGSLDTSEWKISTLADVFNWCFSLKNLDLSGWDTSNWVVTTTASMFAWCESLETLTIGNWDTSGWKVTAMNSMFTECKSLREIDLSRWDTSLFALTTCQSMLSGCTALETLYMPDDFTTSTFKVTNANHQLPYSPVPCLKNFNGYPIAVNTNWSQFYCLSTASLISIINKLPEVSVARTLTLGVAHKQKLTTEQIAIATAKGWTVA